MPCGRVNLLRVMPNEATEALKECNEERIR